MPRDDDRWEDDMIEVAEPEFEPEIGSDEKPRKFRRKN